METITKKEWNNKPKDYKSIIKGQRYMLKWTNSGTSLVPVKVIGMREPPKR